MHLYRRQLNGLVISLFFASFAVGATYMLAVTPKNADNNGGPPSAVSISPASDSPPVAKEEVKK